MAVPPVTDHREQARLGQLREMGAGGWRVIRAAPASSLAVRARPSSSADIIVARAGSPTSAAVSAMMGPVIMSVISGRRRQARYLLDRIVPEFPYAGLTLHIASQFCTARRLAPVR